jgi:DNA-binding response OmpR family regulator
MSESKTYPLVLASLESAALRCELLDGLPNHGWRVLTASTAAEVNGLLFQHRPDMLLTDSVLFDGNDRGGMFWMLKIPCLALVEAGDHGNATRLLREGRVSAVLDLPLPIERIAAALHSIRRLIRTEVDVDYAQIRPREGEDAASWGLDQKAWMLNTPNGSVVRLNQAETTFLAALMESPGTPVSRKALIQSLGHDLEYFDSRRLDTMVSRLRVKVSRKGDATLPVRSIHAMGYAFAAPVKPSE